MLDVFQIIVYCCGKQIHVEQMTGKDKQDIMEQFIDKYDPHSSVNSTPFLGNNMLIEITAHDSLCESN